LSSSVIAVCLCVVVVSVPSFSVIVLVPPGIYSLSLHDALPISLAARLMFGGLTTLRVLFLDAGAFFDAGRYRRAGPPGVSYLVCLLLDRFARGLRQAGIHFEALVGLVGVPVVAFTLD